MASLNAYDDLMADYLPPFIQFGAQIGGLVAEQVQLVQHTFNLQRTFIELASRSAKPTNDAELLAMLKPKSDLICQIQTIRDQNRKHECFNHLSAVAEGIAALGWVTVSPTPAPYVKEMADSAQFYTNKVLVAYKDKPELAFHVNWAKAWIELLHNLQTYIRKHHTTGLVWASVAAPPPPVAAAGGPPPPPPPGFIAGSAPTSADKALEDARAALFASINKGTAITQGLRKVNPEEMTHKNPSLRQSSAVPDKVPKNIGGGGQKGLATKGPEKMMLDGKKWLVENMTGKRDLVISDTQMSQSVCVYRCDDCMLMVKGKINSISVDHCKKFSLVFDSIVSMVEFINSQSIQAQAMEVVPTITIDAVDGIELFLSANSLQAEIVCSKSSAVNISVPAANGDYVEHPIPEQLKSTWDEASKSFKTEAVRKD